MAALTGTVDLPGVRGELGRIAVASGYYALAGAITGHSSTGDTITWSNILPNGGVKVWEAWYTCPELDSHATPTGTAVLGNSDDNDGYIIAQGLAVGLSNSLAEKLHRRSSSEALIGTKVTNRDAVLFFNAALATSATSGTIRAFFLYEVVA